MRIGMENSTLVKLFNSIAQKQFAMMTVDLDNYQISFLIYAEVADQK